MILACDPSHRKSCRATAGTLGNLVQSVLLAALRAFWGGPVFPVVRPGGKSAVSAGRRKTGVFSPTGLRVTKGPTREFGAIALRRIRKT